LFSCQIPYILRNSRKTQTKKLKKKNSSKTFTSVASELQKKINFLQKNRNLEKKDSGQSIIFVIVFLSMV